MFWLAQRHPALIALLCEHLRDDEEFLLHVFFGEVTRHYERLCEEGEIERAEALACDLDAGLACGDEWLENAIHVSFLENLPHEKGSVAWEALTPRLKESFDMIHGYKKSP